MTKQGKPSRSLHVQGKAPTQKPGGRAMAKSLSWVDHLRGAMRLIGTLITWILCKFFLVRISWKETRQREDSPREENITLTDPKFYGVAKILLSHAMREFEARDKRRTSIHEKAKTVMALLAFVISFTGVAAAFSDPGIALLGPVFFTFASAWLIFELFGLSRSGFPDLNQRLLDHDFLSDDESTANARWTLMLADAYVRAARFGDRQTDYITTVFIAAWRSAAFALFAMLIVLGYYAIIGKSAAITTGITSPPSTDSAQVGPP